METIQSINFFVIRELMLIFNVLSSLFKFHNPPAVNYPTVNEIHNCILQVLLKINIFNATLQLL